MMNETSESKEKSQWREIESLSPSKVRKIATSHLETVTTTSISTPNLFSHKETTSSQFALQSSTESQLLLDHSFVQRERLYAPKTSMALSDCRNTNTSIPSDLNDESTCVKANTPTERIEIPRFHSSPTSKSKTTIRPRLASLDRDNCSPVSSQAPLATKSLQSMASLKGKLTVKKSGIDLTGDFNPSIPYFKKTSGRPVAKISSPTSSPTHLTPRSKQCSQQYRLCRTSVLNPTNYQTASDPGATASTSNLAESAYLRLQDPKIALENYLASKNMPPPEYVEKLVQGSVYSYVTVESRKYSSYPLEAKTKDEADKLAAEKALADLLSSKNVSLGVTGDKAVIMTRVLDIVTSHSNGLIKSSLEERYVEKYKEKLPKAWLEIVKHSVVMDIGANNITILRPQHNNSTQKSAADATTVTGPPELSLSELHDFFFKVYAVYNCSDIWGIIIDDITSDEISGLSIKMKHYYDINADTPQTISINGHYAVLDSQNWHRVRCIKVDVEAKIATVLFVDRGDQKTLALSRLCLLHQRFCVVPAQAFSIALAGLEEHQDIPSVRKLLTEMLMNKKTCVTLIGKDKFIGLSLLVQMRVACDGGVLVNVNRAVLEKIKSSTAPRLPVRCSIKKPDQPLYRPLAKTTYSMSTVIPAPQLPDNPFKVKVLLCSDPSNFVVQVVSDHVSEIYKKLFEDLTERCNSNDVERTEVFRVGNLVCCKMTETGVWARAHITKMENTKMATLYLCDYGCHKSAHINSLQHLDKKFFNVPFRAVWAELYGVKPLTYGRWSLEACIKFQKLLEKDEIVCRVPMSGGKVDEANPECKKIVMLKEKYSLILVDKNVNASIADILVSEGLALKC